MAFLRFVPPGLVVMVLGVLIVSQLFYAFLPYRRRAYIPVLVTTAAGFAAGQLWDFVGLPSAGIGQADVLPAVLFAALLQPLARFVPRPEAKPKDPPAPPAAPGPRG